MEPMNPPDPAELLAEHTTWLRSLSRALVRDEALADDLAQDAAVAALERPPAHGASVRAWLRSVVVNRVRELARERAHRESRERLASRPEAQPASDELVARVQIERLVVDRLLALDEAHRTVLLMRFHEDLPPREIARALALPVATVKSRLERGLAKLRAALDREHGGDRRAWLSAVLPLAWEFRSASWKAGGALMGAKVVAGVVAFGALLAWWALAPGSAVVEPGHALARAEPASSIAVETTSPTDESAQPSASPRSEVAQAGNVASARANPEAPDVRVVRGRVLDENGAPLAGVLVGTEAAQPAGSQGEGSSEAGAGGSLDLATPAVDAERRSASTESRRDASRSVLSARDGAFALELDGDRASIVILDPLWATVRPGLWRRESALAPTVVGARAIAIDGVVLDAWGLGVEGAVVSLVLPADFDARFPGALDASTLEVWSTHGAADGVFRFDRLPSLLGARLCAAHEAHGAVAIEAPTSAARGLRLQFGERAPRGAALRGRVVRSDGSAASNARVACGTALAPADARGEFTLDLERALDGTRLVALEPGSLPAEIPRPSGGWPEFVELRLERPALSIAGRVLASDGEPLAGMRVWIADPTPFGVLGSIPLRVESALAGAPVPREAVASLARVPASDGTERFSSARPQRAPDMLMHWVETDDAGRFELGGLLERSYVLAVADRKLQRGTLSAPIEAGTRDLEVRLPADAEALHAKVAGRVVTRAGDPVANVSVQTFVTVVAANERVFGGTCDVTRFFMGDSTRTDGDGRFELASVPRAHVSFALESDAITPTYVDVEAVRDPARFDVVVAARARFEVETSPGFADAIALAKADGTVEQILRLRADGYDTYDALPLEAGRSGVVAATSDAAELRFLRAGVVVESMPLRLRPATTTRIVR